MLWLDNLIVYIKSGKIGKCPKCKSEKVTVAKYKHGERESITFKCEECGSFAHFD